MLFDLVFVQNEGLGRTVCLHQILLYTGKSAMETKNVDLSFQREDSGKNTGFLLLLKVEKVESSLLKMLSIWDR